MNNIEEMIAKLAKENDTDNETINDIITSMGIVIGNGDFGGGGGTVGNVLKLIKKKNGLNELVEKVSDDSGVDEDIARKVVLYMINVMSGGLKNGGVKTVMSMLKAMKQCKKQQRDEDSENDDEINEPDETQSEETEEN